MLAGTVKGAVGLGLPMTAIGILSQAIDPRIAIPLVVFPAMLSNVWQVWRMGETRRALKDYWIFAVFLIVVLWFTTSITAQVSKGTLLVILGSAVILFSASSLLAQPPRLPARYDRPAQAVAGALAGLLGGLTAIWAPPMVIYLLARRVGKDEFVRASGLLLLVGTLPLAAGFWHHGLLDGEVAPLSALMVLPTIAGFQIGAMIRKRMDAQRFQSVVLMVFFLLGLNILRQGLWP